MSISAPARPLACIKQAIRQCRLERRQYATATEIQYPSLQSRYAPPTPGFRPSQATKQNRFETGLKKIPCVPPPRSTTKACPDPISALTQAQISVLDPTGARTRLFSPTNKEKVNVGDILLIRLRTGDPVSGTVLNIRQRHQPIDTAVLLRNQLTRVGVEVWFKIYSPNVEGIEVVQRAIKRARRAKLYYMRQARHDVGSVEGVVKQYLRQRAGGPMGGRDAKGRDAGGSRRKTSKKSKK
ncbi:hypothetical protein LTR22_001759 [Elasticomyces elasticus]|nr:hypothetical protein LTR22_001759 [Elasticomyces elasticus]